MSVEHTSRRRWWTLAIAIAVVAAISLPAQQMVTETRDPKQTQDEDFAKAVKEWTTQPYYISPLVDHLPRVPGIPMPKDVLGYHIGAPGKLTYYADILKYYKALAAACGVYVPMISGRGLGRTGGRYAVLRSLYLSDRDRLTPNELASLLVLTPASVTFLVDGLEKDGLVVRKTNELDRRSRYIELTERGREVCTRLVPAIGALIISIE